MLPNEPDDWKRQEAGHPERVRRRLRAVADVALGRGSLAQVAEKRGISEKSLRSWMRAYDASGVRGLYDKPNSQHLTKLTDAHREELRKAVRGRPYFNGVPRVKWSVTAFVEFMERVLGVSVSPTTRRRELESLGIRYGRARAPRVLLGGSRWQQVGQERCLNRSAPRTRVGTRRAKNRNEGRRDADASGE
jgi:transposase